MWRWDSDHLAASCQCLDTATTASTEGKSRQRKILVSSSGGSRHQEGEQEPEGEGEREGGGEPDVEGELEGEGCGVEEVWGYGGGEESKESLCSIC